MLFFRYVSWIIYGVSLPWTEEIRLRFCILIRSIVINKHNNQYLKSIAKYSKILYVRSLQGIGVKYPLVRSSFITPYFIMDTSYRYLLKDSLCDYLILMMKYRQFWSICFLQILSYVQTMKKFQSHSIVLRKLLRNDF